jgi:hypothetical protein
LVTTVAVSLPCGSPVTFPEMRCKPNNLRMFQRQSLINAL